ncbi:MAG: hypothetical protein RAO92_02760 [Candidatus Euphemobacter frigidus]|nr:hypothetical protein [Candidatus Euphemobacter frigidus]MDP8275300.1 hypothetical protein [Candidatus Euphemobacter frigidus]
MKRIGTFIFVLVLAMSFAGITAEAQQNPGDVWVAPHPLPNGTAIPGYWRPPFKMGFYWVEGKDDGNGNWIPGHWNPVPGSSSGNRAWVPRYWDGVIWVDGFWRPSNRPGYIWIDPSLRNGRRQGGHWRAYEGGQPWKTRFPRP